MSEFQHEARCLRISIYVSMLLGSIGIVWGVVSGSQMILLDGVYAAIGIAVSWLLLQAARIARLEPSRRYPFGRQGVTPLVIGIQGCVLAATLGYAAVEAAFTIRAGGSAVSAGPAIVYGAIITVGCLATWAWLRRAAGHSDLLIAEAIGWRVAALRGVGMLVGFSILAALTGSKWDAAAPYVDPAMVIVMCAVFIPAPIGMIRATVAELIERAPASDVQQAVHAAIDAAAAAHELDPPLVRMTKVGAKLYVEVETTASPSATIAQQQQVRESLTSGLTTLPYEVWLTLELLPRR